jgi:hypothetical protein
LGLDFGVSLRILPHKKDFSMDEVFTIPIQFLTDIVNPFDVDVWGCGPVSIEMVSNAIPNKDGWNPDDDNQIWTAEQHAGRIRFLADSNWNEPISIDVGVPVVGYYKRTILDGHHRLCAAIYSKKTHVPCIVQGQLSVLGEYHD